MELQILSELSKILLKTTLIVTALQGQVIPINTQTAILASESSNLLASSIEVDKNEANLRKFAYPTSSLEYLIFQFTTAYNVDFDLAKAIIECESNFDPLAKNKNSSARGLYQIIKGTWEMTKKKMGIVHADIHDAHDNINVGTYLLANGGEKHWNASRACWSKKLALK